MQAGAREAGDGSVLEASAVEAQAPQARVRRQQRAQQFVRKSHLEEVEGGEEYERVGGAGTESAAGGGGEEEGADVEAGEDCGDDGCWQRHVHRRRRRARLDRIWRERRGHGGGGLMGLLRRGVGGDRGDGGA